MSEFPHERLDVYRVAVEYLALAEDIAQALPRGRAYLADQLRRASLSVSLNVAEGAGEFSQADKARFYRMARRSGTECVAILDACRILRVGDETMLSRGRELLHRVVSMLTAMVVRLSEPGTGTGAGAGAGAGAGGEPGTGTGAGTGTGGEAGTSGEAGAGTPGISVAVRSPP
jgi:four helix bundle protein